MLIRQRIARFILRTLGWTCVDVARRPPRAVLVAYPHTSNWDFPLGLLLRAALGLHIRWAGKDTLFRGPFGPLMRWLGGIPVNRRPDPSALNGEVTTARQPGRGGRLRSGTGR